MTWKDFQDARDAALRGAYCVLWLSAFVFAAFEAYAGLSNMENPDHHYLRALLAALIGLHAAAAHAYLIVLKTKEQTNSGERGGHGLY